MDRQALNAKPDGFDVVVAGSGIAGLALALSLRQAPAPRATVAVCDPALHPDRPATRGLRALAVTAASRRMLQRLGVWRALEAHAQPMTAMVLTDAPPGATPRPVFLDIEDDVAPGEPFASMVFHDVLRDALLEACGQAGVQLRPHAIEDFTPRMSQIALRGTGGEALTARLLVAADGSHSRLRERAGIRSVGWDYGQSGIVATLAHEREHGGRAIQHFLPHGPLALLPMRAEDGSGRRSSLVWSERSDDARRLIGMSDTAFLDALRAVIGHELGALRLEDRPSAHPLRVSLAREVVGERLALVGDAAHTVHPLAGQGLNLGLKDVAVLAAAIGETMQLGLDPGSPALLQAYGRARRADTAAMAATTDLLNRLFSNNSTPLRLLRDMGLSLVDRAPGLKRLLVREAAGPLTEAARPRRRTSVPDAPPPR